MNRPGLPADTASPAADGSPRAVRIHLTAPTLIRAGMETMVVHLARRLHARGHAVEVTCLGDEGPLAHELRAAGVPCWQVHVEGRLPLLWSPALRRHLRARRPDVLHLHGFPGQWVKVLRARPSGVRTITTIHGVEGDEPPHVLALMRWAARRTDRIVAVSDDLAAFLVERVGAPAARVSVIRNGIDADRFTPRAPTGALRGPLGVPPGAPLVGMVGRLDEVKQPLLLVEAFARVHARLPAAHLALVGDGPLRGAVEATAARLGIAGAVHVTGFLDRLDERYADLDVVALASRFEGTSLALLEAMASGVPVVATAVGGNPDLLAHGACGTLVPAGERDALADALLATLEDRDGDRGRRRDAARRRVETDFSEAAMIARYEALYR